MKISKTKLMLIKQKLIVAKNRHGATGSIELTFDKEFTRFRAVDKSNYE